MKQRLRMCEGGATATRPQIMLRIALCGTPACTDTPIACALEACARERGLDSPRFSIFDDPHDLIDACIDIPADEEPFSLVLCTFELPGDTGLHVAHELKAMGLTSDGLRIVLCAADDTHASEAAARGIHGYLVEPISSDTLAHVVGPLMQACAAEAASSVVLNCRSGVRRVALSTISHVTTTGRDQVIHRTGRRPPLALRCSSRALFEQLRHDLRFFKVGSSYIINLDQLSSIALRTGTATMLDGTQIAVPVRLRAQLGEAVCAHAAAQL